MIVVSLTVFARKELRSHRYGRHTKIKRSTKYLVKMVLLLINPLYPSRFIGNADGNQSAISICHGDYGCR